MSNRTTCLVLASTFFALMLGSPANADLVMHLKADGTALDASGNGNDGTLVNGTGYASGILGQAFSFDGSNDYVTVAADPALESTDLFSIAMWVRTPTVGGLKLLADSSHGSSNGNNGWALQLNNIGQASFAYGNGSQFPEVNATTQIDDNIFRHLAATYDGSNLKIYVDGQLEGTTAYSGTPSATGATIRLGRHFSLNRQFLGQMDDIRIYNNALTQSEISSLSSIPEPSSLAILLVLGATVAFRRKR